MTRHHGIGWLMVVLYLGVAAGLLYLNHLVTTRRL